jgi:hypothetical protein
MDKMARHLLIYTKVILAGIGATDYLDQSVFLRLTLEH